MNLLEAKKLLENKGYTLLKEDVNSDGVRKARQWIESSDALTRTGCSSVQELVERARSEFSHLFWREKGQDRFLPGIIRIAIDDCGWLSGDEDPNDITELKAMFIAATNEFLVHKRNNPGEPFDLNADFNGLDFDGLYTALGSRAINAAKAKLS